jgi:hypothetical protein
MHYLMLDGPLPSSSGRQAWLSNGMPYNEWLLTASLRRAGVQSVHVGRPGTPQRWWWRTQGDDRPVGTQTSLYECRQCLRVLELPIDSHRLCLLTPGCHGVYQPNPQLEHIRPLPHQDTRETQCRPYTVKSSPAQTTWRVEGFRGSPLRRRR